MVEAEQWRTERDCAKQPLGPAACPKLEPPMNPIKTKALTGLTFRELTALQAQGWFCCCRRKTDSNLCGQIRLTFSFVFAQFRYGFRVSPRGPLGPSHAPKQQDLKSEAMYYSSAYLRRTFCQSVLLQGAGQ